MKTNYSVIKSIAIAGIIGFSTQAFSQEIIDKVEAVVGSKIILHSDVEKQYVQYIAPVSYTHLFPPFSLC